MTQSPSPTALDLAERLFAAIAAGDVDGVRAIYAPGCVVWHNHDAVEQPAEDNLRTLAWVTRNIRDLRYEEIRRQATETGFVQQHVLRGIAPNGKALEVPACVVGTVADGKITRLDEYLDSAALAVLQS
jgi:ketosteroid isomerase-like protein